LQEQVRTTEAKVATKETALSLTEKELQLYKTLPTKTTPELKRELETIISQIVAHGAANPALVTLQHTNFQELTTAAGAVRRELLARRLHDCSK
jgi:hypothetical protein